MTTAFQAALVLAAANGGKATMGVAGAGATRFVAREIGRAGIWWGTQAALEWLFSQFGWDWNPGGNDPYPPGQSNNCGGCIAYPAGGNTVLMFINGDGQRLTPSQPIEEGGWQELYDWQLDLTPEGLPDPTRAKAFGLTGNGQPFETIYGSSSGFQCLFLSSTVDCIRTGNNGGEATPAPVYVESGDCIYKTQFISYIVDENGQIAGILNKVGPDDRAEGFTAGDGPITQCNIAPTYIYLDARGENDRSIDPIGPDGQELPIDEIVRRIKDPVIDAVNANTDAKLQQYFDERVPMLPGGAWTLQGVCETDEEGALIEPQPTFRWEWGASSSSSMAAQQLLYMSDLIQQQLNFKHRTCKSNGPEQRGQWVDTEWRSLEYSDSGNNVLRKRLRYRSIGDRTIESLVGFWENFAWEAGPVCVIHKGGWWGTPQVWAATEDEGKRVLRKAAENAGFDADAEGEWVVSSSSGSRYGRSGTMNVAIINGSGTSWFAITARDGASGRPDVLTS